MKNSFWKNPWTVGTGTAILSVILLRFIDYSANTKILYGIWSFIKKIGLWFNRQYESPFWFLILIFVSGGLLLLAILFLKFSVTSDKQQSSNEPSFLNYVSDTFEGVFYRWEYIKNYDGKYLITNFTAYCPTDKCILYYNECQICHKHFYNLKANDELEILVRHRVENNLYNR